MSLQEFVDMSLSPGMDEQRLQFFGLKTDEWAASIQYCIFYGAPHYNILHLFVRA